MTLTYTLCLDESVLTFKKEEKNYEVSLKKYFEQNVFGKISSAVSCICYLRDWGFLFLTHCVAFKLNPEMLSWILKGRIQEVQPVCWTASKLWVNLRHWLDGLSQVTKTVQEWE